MNELSANVYYGWIISNLVPNSKISQEFVKTIKDFFSDLVSEYLQYQEATAEDDDDDEEVDRYDNDLEQEDAAD